MEIDFKKCAECELNRTCFKKNSNENTKECIKKTIQRTI